MVVRSLTQEEKEVEKQWVDEHIGFCGLWREGWVMYDGTIVVLHERPGFNGDAYFTRKSTYGLNVQVRMIYYHWGYMLMGATTDRKCPLKLAHC